MLRVRMMPTGDVAKARVKTELRYPVDELAADIADRGIVEPLTLNRYHDGSMRLTGGHHRLAAAELLGLPEVPVVVRRA